MSLGNLITEERGILPSESKFESWIKYKRLGDSSNNLLALLGDGFVVHWAFGSGLSDQPEVLLVTEVVLGGVLDESHH